MKEINKYIVKQLFVGFLMVTGVLIAIMLLTQSLRFIEMVLNKGLSINIFFKLVLLKIPNFFTVLAPISVFVSSVFTYNRLITDRELLVMKSAGLSHWQLVKPAVIFACMITFISLIVGIFISPATDRDFKTLKWSIRNDFSHLMLKEGEFTHFMPGLTAFVSETQKTGELSDVLINDERIPGKKTTFTAENGKIIYTKEGPRIILVKGNRQEVKDDNSGQFSLLSFDRYIIDFGKLDNKNKDRYVDESERSLKELFFMGEKDKLNKKEIREYRVEGNKRLSQPFYNLLFALIATIFLICGSFSRRGQNLIVGYSILIMVILQSLELSIYSLAKKNLMFVPLIYINILVPTIICLYILTTKNNVFIAIYKKIEGRIKNASK